MKIYLATDHAGFALKEDLKKRLAESADYDVEDCGAHQIDATDDYPPFVATAARKVAADAAQGMQSRGIVLGASGQGEAMMANRFPGVRATVFYGGDTQVLKNSRADNDANVLSLGAAFLSEEAAWAAVAVWLNEPFSEAERHVRRITQIETEAGS